MSARNTPQSFGSVTRLFHWMTALLILTAIPLGLYANNLPFDTAETLAWKAQVFSVHKTIGVTAFFVALARILWALVEVHPAPLHPDRRGELFLARLIHWMLYISMLVVPLSGWIHHAAVTGFAPILWPFGQNLPFVPKSEALGALAAGMHWLFTKLLAVSILLHIAGAVKHHLVDRDATLRRMVRGDVAPATVVVPAGGALPVVAAVLLFVLAGGIAAVTQPGSNSTSVATPPLQATSGNWQVAQGTLAFTVKQMGQDVDGAFAVWSAEIAFDETATGGSHGSVKVTIDTTSLTLGSVTDQAKGNDFFNVAAFPQAVFQADLLPSGSAYVAKGDLTLRGASVPVEMPFTLKIEGDRATMAGSTTLDRRAFGMGMAYGDESSVGFTVTVTVDLVAERAQ